MTCVSATAIPARLASVIVACSMSGVSSLTGYVTDANGRKLVFSMVTNNYVVAGARVKALENRLATALANSTDY